MKNLGFSYEFGSNKQLQESLDKIHRSNDPFFNKLVRIMTTRAMNEAHYFCTADFDEPEFYHYGLATDFYTHFTSPIRRYADILVHRLLAAAIDVESLPKTMSNNQKMTKICDQMNRRNRMARFAGRASSDYHMYLLFKNKTVVDKAIISVITKTTYSVILPKYGLESVTKFTPEELVQNEKLQSEKKAEDNIIMNVIIQGEEYKLFDYIKVKISVGMRNFHKQVVADYQGRWAEQ